MTGVMYPQGVYSRVVSVGVPLGTMPGVKVQFVTGFGDQLWLLAVKVWATFEPDKGIPQVAFRVKTGQSDPLSQVAFIKDGWDDVIPLEMLGHAWRAQGLEWAFSWDMNKLYTGGGRQFGLWVQDGGGVLGWIFASFQISEG